MGNKPSKYWDYRECAWVNCPTPADEAGLRVPKDAVVPAQERPAEPAQAGDASVVGSTP